MFDSRLPDPPGPDLAVVLDTTDPAELDDWDLIEAIRGWERLASWVAAGQLAAIAEFARRRPRSFLDSGPEGHADAGDPGAPEISEFAVNEVAAALRLSRPAAGVRLHLAVELTRLPRTAAALRAGVIDVPRVRAVAEAVTALDDSTARAVEECVLPRAGAQTVGRLRASLSRAVFSVDPAGAEARHARAVAGRQVSIRPLSDGMAGLWALLPADHAAGVCAAVDAVARRGPADDRDMDARRADALVALVTGSCQAGATGAEVQVTVPAATALGLSDEPGELAGHGPIPASMARRLAERGTWRGVGTDPETGVVIEVGRAGYTPSAALADLVRARDATCRFPGCRQPARRCDLDHVVPWPEGATRPGNLVALCRHHHRLKHQTRWQVEVDDGATLVWTSPTGHRYTTSPLGP